MKKTVAVCIVFAGLHLFLTAGTNAVTIKPLSVDEFERRFALIEKIRTECANLLLCAKNEIDSKTFDIYIIEHGASEDGDIVLVYYTYKSKVFFDESQLLYLIITEPYTDAVQDSRLYNLSFMRDPTKLFYNWNKN
ncbi:hypothetical protein [Treponema socranskii]|uniref:hypothetical protein n=1 Tax=Treponema socranskii TaxID=53419 RepID=UPI003D6E4634